MALSARDIAPPIQSYVTDGKQSISIFKLVLLTWKKPWFRLEKLAGCEQKSAVNSVLTGVSNIEGCDYEIK